MSSSHCGSVWINHLSWANHRKCEVFDRVYLTALCIQHDNTDSLLLSFILYFFWLVSSYFFLRAETTFYYLKLQGWRVIKAPELYFYWFVLYCNWKWPRKWHDLHKKLRFIWAYQLIFPPFNLLSWLLQVWSGSLYQLPFYSEADGKGEPVAVVGMAKQSNPCLQTFRRKPQIPYSCFQHHLVVTFWITKTGCLAVLYVSIYRRLLIFGLCLPFLDTRQYGHHKPL